MLQLKTLSRGAAAAALSCLLAMTPAAGSFPALAASVDALTVENCGAYLFGWRPVDCGNGQYFVILVGGNTIQESNVILNRGYDYAYTFDSSQTRPWGEVPDLVNVDGVWAIPENQAQLPENTQASSVITLVTNNGNSSTRERYIHVVHLPGNVSASSLPAEVRKYLINTDGSDAGAYEGTSTAGWVQENGRWRYQQANGSYVSGTWLNVDGEDYYLNADGYMLADTITADGYYVGGDGSRKSYIPGWKQDERGWRYLLKNGRYATLQWVLDTDGRWYYFNMGSYMAADYRTPDGYYVGADGVWDGADAISSNPADSGPGVQ